MSYNTDGWVDNPDAVEEVTSEVGVFSSTADFLSNTGKGKIVCLHDNYTKLGMTFPQKDQNPAPSCTAFGIAGGIDVLKVTEIVNGERETFLAETATEPIYYGARVVVGKNSIRGGGAVVAHGVKYVNAYGVLARQKYGQIDLTYYSPDRCVRWGNNSGFPKTLESLSKENVVMAYSRVKSYEECRDSIANNHPVSWCKHFVCSIFDLCRELCFECFKWAWICYIAIPVKTIICTNRISNLSNTNCSFFFSRSES